MSGVQQGLLRSGLLLSLALMAGRLAGFARELVLASTLGLSTEADLAILLLTLPDLLTNLLLSGGLSVALLPVLRNATSKTAASLFFKASSLVAASFCLVALAAAQMPRAWIGVMAPGLSLPDGFLQSGALYALVMAIPFTALAGVSTSALNASDRFFMAGCGTLLFNSCVIAGLLYHGSDASVLDALCWAVLLGAALRWSSQLAFLPRRFWRLRSSGRLLDAPFIQAFGAGLAASSLLILVPVIIRAFASLLGAGQIAAFNYANKLVELPLGVLITTLATVAYPRLCELHANRQDAAAAEVLRRRLQQAAILSLAVVGAGLWFSDSIVAVLLGRGKLAGSALGEIESLLHVGLLSVPMVGIAALMAAALNARQQSAAVMRITGLCLLLLLVLCMPGWQLASAPLLMAAMLGFHGALAALLSRAGRVAWVGTGGWLDARTCTAALAMTGLLACFALLDVKMALQPLQRSVLAALAFAAIAFLGLRMVQRSQ